jgi:hypothetical protein
MNYNLQTPCCNKVYVCRLCHDDKEEHKLDRQSVNIIKCLQCEKEQEVCVTTDPISRVEFVTVKPSSNENAIQRKFELASRLNTNLQ